MNWPYDYEKDDFPTSGESVHALRQFPTFKQHLLGLVYDLGVTNGEYARFYTERKLEDAKSHNDAASGTRQAPH